MLFPKGPRFEPQKFLDVPGPGTYNVEQESNLEAYKRGAFLEKTDRFNKDPGPGTYDTDTKLQTKPMTMNVLNLSAADRYAALQRKLEDLERIHADGKKSHQVEVERLKLEHTRSRQTTSDQSDRLEKLKKQNDTLDVRLQDMKKSASADQAEIKDLRAKLRTAEHERTQLSSKQGEAGETKKALQALEDEMRERDRKISELEKALAGEKKKREGADAKLTEAKAKADEEIQKVRQTAQSLQGQVDAARNEARRAQSSLTNLEGHAENNEEELLSQLEQHWHVLGRDYGGLYDDSENTITAFWNVVDSFDQEQRRALMRFVTSCSRPPLLGFREIEFTLPLGLPHPLLVAGPLKEQIIGHGQSSISTRCR